MLSYLCLFMISTMIGVLIGSVGLGGFFLPPALMAFADITVHQSMATSLFTFIFTGIAGSIYFHKRRSINWALVRPICFGAALTGFAGAWVGSKLSTSMLSVALAIVIMAAGLYTLASDGEKSSVLSCRNEKRQWMVLASIGAVTGFISGLTGIGGPALSVPLMVFFGFSIMTSIATGQVLQIVGALSGTIANLKYGTIDYGLATFISVSEIFGVLLGAYIIHRIEIRLIKKLMGGLCLIAGCVFIVRSL
jgi:uncharacterized membrane protein YfcA